jgi:hypothetical protein
MTGCSLQKESEGIVVGLGWRHGGAPRFRGFVRRMHAEHIARPRACRLMRCYKYSHKHPNPRTASIATLPLHKVHRMNHIPFQASTTTNQQKHASEVLTQNRQVYSTWPSVGRDNPGQKLEPLDLANTPKDARYARKLPLHKPTLNSLRAPATKDDRETPPGPAASSPRSCKCFIAGWLISP